MTESSQTCMDKPKTDEDVKREKELVEKALKGLLMEKPQKENGI